MWCQIRSRLVHIKSCYPPKSHQIAGVNWLIDLYSNNFKGALLADDMGLGKTYQIIAFLTYLYRHVKPFQRQHSRILIVAPTILLNNWKVEIDKFMTDELRCQLGTHIIRGSDLKNRKQVNETKDGQFNSFDVMSFLERKTDVVITSYQILANYQFSFADKAFQWGCIIYDEAHKIKNPNSQISQASRAISSGSPFNILLTGTPIENELRDLWALFDVFDPKHFGSWKKFKEEFVRNDDNVDFRLRQKASNYILRRHKKEHLKGLPEKIEKTHEVIFSDYEAILYNKYKDSTETALQRLNELKRFSLYGDLLTKTLSNNINDTKSNFSKIEKLIDILLHIKENHEKTIIFCINRVTQIVLQQEIHKYLDIQCHIINGDNNSSNKVNRILEQFSSSKGFNVLILSTLAAGVGLTITSANHVIHYERWWNASKEDQASDRAYRIGQDKDVYVHYLITKHPDQSVTTIDQAIHDLISKKRETAGFLIPPKTVNTFEIIDHTLSASMDEKVSALSFKEFEGLILRIYEKLGYECHLTEDGKREFGADIIAKKDIERIAIQCKHTTKNNVQSEKAITQLGYEAQNYYQTKNLIAVTNSKFNNLAKEMAIKLNVKLIERKELFELMQKVNLVEF